jgi:hypothetical protein
LTTAGGRIFAGNGSADLTRLFTIINGAVRAGHQLLVRGSTDVEESERLSRPFKAEAPAGG